MKKQLVHKSKTNFQAHKQHTALLKPSVSKKKRGLMYLGGQEARIGKDLDKID